MDKLRSDGALVPPSDELAAELIILLTEADLSEKQRSKVLLTLVPYIVRRDHTIHNHAYKVGRASV